MLPSHSKSVARPMLLVAMASLAFLEGRELKSFESREHRFTVRYPADWHIESISGHFYIESFLAERAIRGVRLPPGGASIGISVPSELLQTSQPPPRNREELIALATHHRRVLARRSFEIGEGARTLSVEEIQTQVLVIPPRIESVDWYFDVAGNSFVANLEYWQGDKNALKWRAILQSVVLSITPHPNN